MGQIQDLLPEGQRVTLKYWSPVHRPLNWLGVRDSLVYEHNMLQGSVSDLQLRGVLLVPLNL